MEVEKQRKNNEAFLKLRNTQCIQQSILILILNQYFNITLQIPSKRSVVAMQFLRIEKIQRENDVIEVEKYVEIRCREKYEKDIQNGISEKTAKRRYETNRITEQLHLMIDIMRELGCEMESKLIGGKKGTTKIENIQKIKLNYMNQQIDINKNEFEIIGNYVNEMMMEKIFNRKEKEITMNDIEIQIILLKKLGILMI